MTLYVLLIILPILALIAFFLLSDKDKGFYKKLQFTTRGKDAGFGFSEIRLLWRIAKKAEMEDPAALFWSVRQLDLAIADYLKKLRMTGDEHAIENQDFLSRLYAYRQKIEYDQPLKKKGIKSSRSIASDQRLRLLVHGYGVVGSLVLHNTDRFLTVAQPEDSRFPAGFAWKGQKLSVYFWRKDDAGYVFDTYVLDEVLAKSGSVLQLAHSDSLFRTQKRRSVRAKTQLSAYLYIPETEAALDRIETEPGLLCIVEDLSEDGCAVTIGGKCPVDLRVKVQFELDNRPLVMSGTVKSIEYNASKNRSLLHVEALPLPIHVRNQILAQVFGVAPAPDSEEDLPVLDLDSAISDVNDDSEGAESPLEHPEEASATEISTSKSDFSSDAAVHTAEGTNANA